jgi:hypothetical protein
LRQKKIVGVGLIDQLQVLLEEYGLTNKIIFYVKDKKKIKIIYLMTIVFKLIVNCDVLGI